MYGPLVRASSTFDGPTPLHETCLLADVDLLSASDQPNHDAPLRDPLRELDEMLRLGLVAAVFRVLRMDHLGIECTLRLIEHEHVLRRHQSWPGRVGAYVILHPSHEGLSAAAGSAKFVLQHFDERAVPAEKYGWRRGLGKHVSDEDFLDFEL